MRRALVIASLVLIIAAAAAGGHQYALPYLIDLTRRGRRLTSTVIDADGSVRDEPEALADAAASVVGRPVSVHALALSRMLRSEEGGQPAAVKRLLAHVALNEAERRGVTLLHLLTTSTVASRAGKLGEQKSRWASTKQDSYEIDLGVAEQAIAERAAGEPDPTAGALRFVDRLAFGVQPGTGTYASLLERWGREGFTPVRIAPAPSRIVFFRRSSGEAVS